MLGPWQWLWPIRGQPQITSGNPISVPLWLRGWQQATLQGHCLISFLFRWVCWSTLPSLQERVWNFLFKLRRSLNLAGADLSLRQRTLLAQVNSEMELNPCPVSWVAKHFHSSVGSMLLQTMARVAFLYQSFWVPFSTMPLPRNYRHSQVWSSDSSVWFYIHAVESLLGRENKAMKMDQIRNARCAFWVVSSEKEIEGGVRHFVPLSWPHGSGQCKFGETEWFA